MKITIKVDCTPVEAREFMGLPDVTPLHDAYLERMRGLIDKGITPDIVGDVVKSWGTMGDAGVALAQQLFGQISSAATRKR